MPRGTKAPPPAQIDKALEIAAEINKEYGEGTIVRGSEIQYDLIPRIPSGSLSLDGALGGGWTVNSWHEIYGNESSGKTTVILKTIAANQARDPNWRVFWVAAEDFVPEWAELLGCDRKRILVMHTNEMERAYGAVIRYLESRSVDCVVIDSMPALVPSSEDESTILDQQVGLAARINGKFFRKQNPAMRRSLVNEDRPVTGFIVNQFREKIGIAWGDPRTTPGGKAKNFYYFTRVELSRDEWITEGEKKNAHKVGITIKARVTKNKTAPPERLAAFDFYFDHNEATVPAGNYDEVKDIFAIGLHYGVIKQAVSQYYFEGESWKGRAALLNQLAHDLTLQEGIRSGVMACMVKGRQVEVPAQPTKAARAKRAFK